MDAAVSKRKTSYWIHLCITILFMFGFRFLSAPEPITPYGMQILGIFIGLVWGWSFCDLAWPSVLAMVALGISDYGITSAVFEASFGQANLILIILSFLMFAPVTESGLSKWLGMKLLTVKAVKGKPLFMIGIIYFGTLILSVFVNGLVVGIFMMQLFIGIFKQLGYQKGDRFIPMFLVGMFICTGLGSILIPFRSMPLMVFGVIMKAGIPVNNNGYFIFAILVCVLLILSWLLLIKLLKCNISPLKDADFTAFEEELKTPLTKYQSMLLKIIVAFIGGIIFVGVLGKAGENPFLNTLNSIGVYGVMALAVVIMLLINVEGKQMLNLKTAAASVNWDFVFLYAMAMLMSSLITDQTTGISSYVIKFITPIMAGLGTFWFLMLLGIVTLVLTNIGNNIVVIFTMTSVVVMMVTQGLPINGMLAATIVLWTGLVTGYLTPAASVTAAMIFGSDMTTTKGALLQGVIVMCYWLVSMAIFIIPLGMFFLQ